MLGLGSGAITPYRIHHLLALIRTSRIFSLEVSRRTKCAGPLRRADARRVNVAMHHRYALANVAVYCVRSMKRGQVVAALVHRCC